MATRGDSGIGALLSLIGLGCAAVCYAAAFSFGDRNAVSRINFYLYSWLALLFEDFRQGRPATLFVGLACYGSALIVVSRMILLRGTYLKP